MDIIRCLPHTLQIFLVKVKEPGFTKIRGLQGGAKHSLNPLKSLAPEGLTWCKHWCPSNKKFPMVLRRGHSQPAPTSTPSTGCLLLLSCG